MPNPLVSTMDYYSPSAGRGAGSGRIDPRFTHPQYVIRKKVFKLFGAAFHVYDLAGNVVMYSKQKAFKLKEDIRLYTGEDMQTELLVIQARAIIDFSAAYDVMDPRTGEKVGALKRKGWKSMLRDEWVIMDTQDQEIGTILEDSTALALIRRFIDSAALFLPQKYHVMPLCSETRPSALARSMSTVIPHTGSIAVLDCASCIVVSQLVLT